MPPPPCRPGHCVCRRPDCVSNARLIQRLFSAVAGGRPRFTSATADKDFRRWLEPLARVSITSSDLGTHRPSEQE
jgi:hypothetical protein